jgi:hypothetical protein
MVITNNAGQQPFLIPTQLKNPEKYISGLLIPVKLTLAPVCYDCIWQLWLFSKKMWTSGTSGQEELGNS